MFQDDLFKGKNALVTGGRSGIGYAIATALSQAGVKVMLCDIEEDALNAAVARLCRPGRRDRHFLRAWIDGHLAFEKTDVRFRLTNELKIEQIWMNLYHQSIHI